MFKLLLILSHVILLTLSLIQRDFQKGFYHNRHSTIKKNHSFSSKICLEKCLIQECFAFALDGDENCVLRNQSVAQNLVKVHPDHFNSMIYWVDSSVISRLIPHFLVIYKTGIVKDFSDEWQKSYHLNWPATYNGFPDKTGPYILRNDLSLLINIEPTSGSFYSWKMDQYELPVYEPSLSLNLTLAEAAHTHQNGKGFVMKKNKKTFAFENGQWKSGPDFWVFKKVCLTFVPFNDNHVYIIGGIGNNDVMRSKISRYNFDTNSIVNDIAEIPSGSVYDCACTGVIANDQQALVVIGGYNDQHLATKKVNIYYIGSDTWDTLTDYPFEFNGGIAVSVRSKVYVFGGSENLVYMYDFQGSTNWIPKFEQNSVPDPVMVLPYNFE